GAPEVHTLSLHDALPISECGTNVWRKRHKFVTDGRYTWDCEAVSMIGRNFKEGKWCAWTIRNGRPRAREQAGNVSAVSATASGGYGRRCCLWARCWRRAARRRGPTPVPSAGCLTRR